MFKRLIITCCLLLFMSITSSASATSTVNAPVNLLSSNEARFTVLGPLAAGDVVEVGYEAKGYVFVGVRQSINFSLLNKNGWLPVNILTKCPPVAPEAVDLDNMVHRDLATLKKLVVNAQEPKSELKFVRKEKTELRPEGVVTYGNAQYEVLLTPDLQTIILLSTMEGKLSTPAGLRVGDNIGKVLSLYGKYDYNTTVNGSNTVMTWINPGYKGTMERPPILASKLQVELDKRTAKVVTITVGEVF